MKRFKENILNVFIGIIVLGTIVVSICIMYGAYIRIPMENLAKSELSYKDYNSGKLIEN